MHLCCTANYHQHAIPRRGEREREGEADGEGHTGNSKKNHLLVDPLLGCIESDGLATRLDVVAGIRNVADTSSARGGQSLHRSGGNVREGDTSGESIACLERGRHFHYLWGLLIDLERIDGVELRTVGGAEQSRGGKGGYIYASHGNERAVASLVLDESLRQQKP